ncbi:unnamed protein product [Closterium sp. Naga37s-1]|nr:unnamed protein product [Closterium sp. Naga37s-1]
MLLLPAAGLLAASHCFTHSNSFPHTSTFSFLHPPHAPSPCRLPMPAPHAPSPCPLPMPPPHAPSPCPLPMPAPPAPSSSCPTLLPHDSPPLCPAVSRMVDVCRCYAVPAYASRLESTQKSPPPAPSSSCPTLLAHPHHTLGSPLLCPPVSPMVDLCRCASEADLSFFCPNHQQQHQHGSLSSVRILGLLTDAYLLPALYHAPHLQADLERLFPDRLPLMHVGSYLLHPANYLWEEITRAFRAYLAPHQHRVGIQIREFQKYIPADDVLDRVVDCLVNVTQVVPPILPQEDWEKLMKQQPLAAEPSAGRVRPASGAAALSTLSHDGAQQLRERKQAERAMREMWLLSMCQVYTGTHHHCPYPSPSSPLATPVLPCPCSLSSHSSLSALSSLSCLSSLAPVTRYS